MCKKIIVLAIIFMTCITINVNANTTNEITMNSTNTTVGVGDEIEIVVSAKSENGIEGIDGILKYDKTKLKLVNEDELVTSDFGSVSGFDEENDEFRLSILYTGTGEAPTSAEFAKLKFEVLNKARGTLSVELIDIQMGDSKDEWIEPEDVTINFTVENTNEGGLGLVHYAIIIFVIILLIAIISKKRKR